MPRTGAVNGPPGEATSRGARSSYHRWLLCPGLGLSSRRGVGVVASPPVSKVSPSGPQIRSLSRHHGGTSGVRGTCGATYVVAKKKERKTKGRRTRPRILSTTGSDEGREGGRRAETYSSHPSSSFIRREDSIHIGRRRDPAAIHRPWWSGG